MNLISNQQISNKIHKTMKPNHNIPLLLLRVNCKLMNNLMHKSFNFIINLEVNKVLLRKNVWDASAFCAPYVSTHVFPASKGWLCMSNLFKCKLMFGNFFFENCFNFISLSTLSSLWPLSLVFCSSVIYCLCYCSCLKLLPLNYFITI